MRMNRHHLLEIILWPNGDGTFRKILNSRARLIELGIYDDWKLTITIQAREHSRMHARNRSDDTTSKISAAKKGKSSWIKGKKLSEEAKAKISAAQIGNTNAKGCKRSAEIKVKLSAARKGLRWYTNGVVNKLTKECPLGFTRGKLQKKRAAK